MSKSNPKYLDNKEKDLSESIEKLDIEKLEHPFEEEQLEFKNASTQFIKRETKMNIRVLPYELQRIKEQAAKEGLKYQTFIKSVLHRYITGQLIDKDKIAR